MKKYIAILLAITLMITLTISICAEYNLTYSIPSPANGNLLVPLPTDMSIRDDMTISLRIAGTSDNTSLRLYLTDANDIGRVSEVKSVQVNDGVFDTIIEFIVKLNGEYGGTSIPTHISIKGSDWSTQITNTSFQLLSIAVVENFVFNLSSDGYYYTLSRCNYAGNVVIPDEHNGIPVKEIGSTAFFNVNDVTSVIIPDSVTNIAESAFSGCSNLASIHIGSGLSSTGKYAFRNCSNLTSIEVDPANRSYYSVGNCLVERKSKTLIFGCKGSDLSGVLGITDIGAEAFYGAGITDIVIPNTVTTISSKAFSGCSELKEIHIPKSVKYICDEAFAGCSSLERIVYAGSESEWDGLFKGAYWNNQTGEYEVVFQNGVSSKTSGDLNGDGTVNVMDLILLAKYIAGWDVTLY